MVQFNQYNGILLKQGVKIKKFVFCKCLFFPAAVHIVLHRTELLLHLLQFPSQQLGEQYQASEKLSLGYKPEYYLAQFRILASAR